MIIGVLMAGGKGERMNTSIEKPLVELTDKPLIDHVLSNLKKSQYIEKVVVAVSPHTNKTKKYLEKQSFNNINVDTNENDKNNTDYENLTNDINNNIGINSENPKNITSKKYSDESSHKFYTYIETPGNGYLNDLSFLLNHFEKESSDNILLFINSDLPFVAPKIVDYVIGEYLKNDKEAMSVLVPLSIFEKYGIKPSYVLDDLVPSGLNILISKNKTQNEEKLIIPKIELALNINTIDDIELANYLINNNQIHGI